MSDELRHAEIRGPRTVLVTFESGLQFSVYVDEKGYCQAGRECSTMTDDGYVIEYLMPLGREGVLSLPVNMRVRKA